MMDPTQLHRELQDAGLRIYGCSSDGRIDWIDPPTAAEDATAAQILAAHDPTKREREDAAERDGLRALVASMLSATIDATTWQGLTAVERSEFARKTTRATALLIRRLIQ